MKDKAELKLIVCVGKDNIIGDSDPEGNGLLWHSKEELSYYKEMTVGNITLFGKKTASVIPIELMKKNREVVVLERDTDIDKILMDGNNREKIVYICGGLSIYKYFLENFEIDELLISKLKSHIEVKNAKTPLYFPHVEDYGYKKMEVVEYNDFIVEKYRK